MIGNLFSNIRRHTPDDVHVSVKLTTHGSEIIFVVEDGGPGLADYQERSRFLKRFTSQRSSDGGGSGLGLSLVSGVIERYNGTLRLTKSELGGLKVEVRLPSQLLAQES